MAKLCDPNIKRIRKKEDIPVDTLNAIRTVTANMETLPVGTFKYSLFKYPGDIDIFEALDTCCTFNVSRLNAANTIQNIVRKILSSENILFSEFKAGYDDRFNIYTGVFDDKGIFVDFYPFVIRRDIINLFDSGLLDLQQKDHLLSLVKDEPSLQDILDLNEELRNFRVVRWTATDVLNGFKVLPGNYKLYLDVALTQGSIVKIDTIAYVNDRYIELTNFFLVSQTDKFGKKKILSEELGDYQQSLLSDVHKYYESNTLKSVKRYWMYLAYKNKLCKLSEFKELFSSRLALYSQVSADIEVAILLLKSTNLNYNPDLLFSSIAQRLQLLDGICTNSSSSYHDIHSNEYSVISDNLEILNSCIKDYINIETKQWLLDNDIDILHS